MSKFYKLFIILFMFIVLLISSSSWAASSSASYKITTEVLNSTGGAGTSTSYKVLGSGSNLALGLPGSTSYIVKEGFLQSAIYSLAVLVTSITPATGYNTGIINITNITGAGFNSGATVKLTKSGQFDISALGVNVVNATTISCSFDLTGKVTGLWNLVVTNPGPGGSSASLPSAFNIKSHVSASLPVINSPNPFNPTRGSTTIVYQLDNDTNITLLIFNISGELIWRQDFASGTNGGRIGDNSVVWDGYSTNRGRELVANGAYIMQVFDRVANKIIKTGTIAVLR